MSDLEHDQVEVEEVEGQAYEEQEAAILRVMLVLFLGLIVGQVIKHLSKTIHVN